MGPPGGGARERIALAALAEAQGRPTRWPNPGGGGEGGRGRGAESEVLSVIIKYQEMSKNTGRYMKINNEQ